MSNVIKIKADPYVTPSGKDPKKKITYKKRLEEIDSEMNKLNEKEREIKQEKGFNINETNEQLDVIQKQKESLRDEKMDMTKDVRKKIEARKRKDWYQKSLKNAKGLVKAFGTRDGKRVLTEDIDVFNDDNGGNSSDLKDNNKKFSEKFREEELKRRGFEQVKNKDGSNQT